MGLVQLKILCPKNLKYPFLQIRNKNEKSIAPTCFSCGFKSNSKINSCKHDLLGRAIEGTFYISEINFAIELGYQIIKIFSAFVYKKSEPLLRDFISYLGLEKITSCKFDPSLNLKEISEKMFFKKELQQGQFEENLEKRNFIKLTLNSFLGKFSQKAYQTTTKLISSEEEICKYFYSKTFTISEIVPINKHFCSIQLKRKRKTLTNPSLRTNCILGGQIVAFAREFMQRQILKLEKINAKIFYIDTDSLIFSLKKTQRFPFEISPCFGDFKFEIPVEDEILNFFSLGPKNFTVQYKNNEGILKDIVKLRGVTLSNEINNKIIDSKLYDLYLREYLKNNYVEKSIPQVRSHVLKYKKIKVERFQKVFFSNSIKSKRIVDKNSPILDTFPFGFCEEK